MAPLRHDILQTFVFGYIEHVMGGSQVCAPPYKCTHYNFATLLVSYHYDRPVVIL